ncbi:MAG: sigma-54-dependent transcriptional regulator [Thermoguttaceae bacterium]
MATISEPDSRVRRQRILVIDDEAYIGLGCARALRPLGYEVEACEEPRVGLEAALTGDFDIVLLDLRMEGIDGLEILKHLKAAGTASEVVIITGHSTVETAVEAMRHGAADYLSKPFTPDELKRVVGRVAEKSALLRENAALRRELDVQRGFEGILGESRAMERVFGLIQRVAPTEGTVLVTGESGTGKEMVVRAIHRLSRRKEHALLACDCSALAPTLLESELFGHVKGSFSGAIATKEGLFEAAHGGTLFLDEVANISLETQGKLLRALETRRVRRVGDTAEQAIDIRLIAATNRDLAEMVREGSFREDLYYRLNVVPIFLPPLRDRENDIPTLAVAFLDRYCRKMDIEAKRFAPASIRMMEGHSWPGNVRELRNIVERLAILSDGAVIEPRHLPEEMRRSPLLPDAAGIPGTWDEVKRLKREVRETGKQLERRFVASTLERHGGNVSRAAKAVGMQRTNFHALMRKHGIKGEGP